jgi:hypothetical protein
MLIKKLHVTFTALALSLFALSASPIFAGAHLHRPTTGVKPAQANYQDEVTFVPSIDQQVPFFIKNFRNSVRVNSNRTVFEVAVAGLYSLDAFLTIQVPTVGDAVAGYIAINQRQMLTFFNREVSTTPIVNFHFNDRLVYLEKGDRVSVVLTEFAPGTLVLSRGFVMVAFNNSSCI